MISQVQALTAAVGGQARWVGAQSHGTATLRYKESFNKGTASALLLSCIIIILYYYPISFAGSTFCRASSIKRVRIHNGTRAGSRYGSIKYTLYGNPRSRATWLCILTAVRLLIVVIIIVWASKYVFFTNAVSERSLQMADGFRKNVRFRPRTAMMVRTARTNVVNISLQCKISILRYELCSIRIILRGSKTVVRDSKVSLGQWSSTFLRSGPRFIF